MVRPYVSMRPADSNTAGRTTDALAALERALSASRATRAAVRADLAERRRARRDDRPSRAH